MSSSRASPTPNAEDEVRTLIRSAAPRHVFVSLATPQAGLLPPIAAAARSEGVPVLVGGPHATFCTAEVLAIPGVTGAVRGEGEHAMRAYLAGDRAIRGLVRPGDPVAGFGELADLQALPPPDREPFLACPDFTFEGKIMGHELAASRGCPLRCRYCTNAGYNDTYGPPYLRRLTVGAVVAEARAALALEPRARVVGFHDDIFAADTAWLAEFSRVWPGAIRMPIWVNCHPALLTRERVALLKRAGCTRVHMGVESGNEELRQRVLGRTVTNATILEAARRLRDAGMRIVVFVMLGIPGECEATYRDTVELLRRVRPDWILQSYFVPLPGTPLGLELKAQVPETPWQDLAAPSFYLDPLRSWSAHIDTQRLAAMGRGLLRAVYRD